LKNLLSPYVRSVETDNIGNLYAFIGKNKGPIVMLSAHMDEVALVVNRVTERGFIKVIPQGLLRPEQFFLQHVVVLGGKGIVPGIANIPNGHTNTSLHNVLIDIGAHSEKDVHKLGIRCGDRVCFSPQIRPLGADMIVGKAADDRTGLYVLAEVARQLEDKDLEIQLVLVATVQEEGVDTFVAWAGAHIAAQKLNPVLMLGIDTIDAWDWIPMNSYQKNPSIRLDGGLGVLRGAQDLHPGLVDHLLAQASANGFQHQIVPLAATVADYTTISRAREGVPCAGLVIPVRHPHSASEIFKWKTVEDIVNLLLNILSEPQELLSSARQFH